MTFFQQTVGLCLSSQLKSALEFMGVEQILNWNKFMSESFALKSTLYEAATTHEIVVLTVSFLV